MLRKRLVVVDVLMALVFAGFGIACSGDGDPAAPSPTASPGASATSAGATATLPAGNALTPTAPAATPTAPGGAVKDCPDAPSLCAFASYLALRFEAGDFAAVVREAAPREVTCKADYSQGMDPDALLCSGKPAGTTVTAYDTGRTYSEGVRTTAEGLEALFRGYVTGAAVSVSDDYGNGAFRMYSIGKRDCADCRNKHTLIYSRIYQPASAPGASAAYVRDALILSVVSQASAPDAWKIDLVLTGIQLGADIPTRLGGGKHPDGSVYMVWNPKDGTAPAGKGPIWLGAAVKATTGGDCLNLRKDPSRSAAIVICLPDGGTAVVSGPAQQADGITWWPVRTTGSEAPNVAGWASGEFLAPVVN